jgi:hypothetical protein
VQRYWAACSASRKPIDVRFDVHHRRPVDLCVPITSSTSCAQVIFVDQAAAPSLSSDAVQVEVDRLG